MGVPVELRLPLVPAVGAQRVDAEREALGSRSQGKSTALSSLVALVDAQRPDPRRVVDGRELAALQAMPLARELQELHVELDVVKS
jgi:hypothetical protein